MSGKDYKKKIKRKEKEVEEILSNIIDVVTVFLIVVLAIGGAVCMFGLIYILLKIITP